MDLAQNFDPGDIVQLKETATRIGPTDFSLCDSATAERWKEKYRKWRFKVVRILEDEHDKDGNSCLWLERLDTKSHERSAWSPALVELVGWVGR